MSDSHYVSLRDRLQRKERRPLDRTREAIAHAPPAPISVTRAHEISALAVGLLVLKHVEETGRTRLHEQAIQESLKRVTEHLNAADMMRLEVEAYEIVDWLVGGNGVEPNADFVAEKIDGGVRYDPSSSIPEIVREAVAQGFDLKIAYYSGKRMEMNSRVISAKAIAAEVYVRAFCHERKDERIFRMDRIRSAVPIGGAAIHNPYFEHVLSEQDAEQQSLELEHLAFGFDDVESAVDRPKGPTTPPWADNAAKSQPVEPTEAAAVVPSAAVSSAAASSAAVSSAAMPSAAVVDPKSDEQTKSVMIMHSPTAAKTITPSQNPATHKPNELAKTVKPAQKPTTPKPNDLTKTVKSAQNAKAPPPVADAQAVDMLAVRNNDAQADGVAQTESAHRIPVPAPALTLSPTPTDKELRAMEFRRQRLEEQEAERKAAAEASAGDDDDQLTFF